MGTMRKNSPEYLLGEQQSLNLFENLLEQGIGFKNMTYNIAMVQL